MSSYEFHLYLYSVKVAEVVDFPWHYWPDWCAISRVSNLLWESGRVFIWHLHNYDV